MKQFSRACVRRVSIVLAASASLTACERGPEPLAPTPLSDMQATSLNNMNEAGRQAFWGWTWRYELGAGCVLRVTREYDGKAASVANHLLKGATTAVAPNATVGFGVKATLSKGINADLFDTDSEANANQFAAEDRRLIEGCS